MNRTNWFRYCVPLDGVVQYDRDGFPNDPEEMGDIFQPSATSLATVLRSPCVVLIGEPGIGKSDTLKQLSMRAAVPGEQRLFVNLADDIGVKMFSAKEFRHWKAGGGLELFIDSLDENLKLARRLRSELRDGGSRNNLRLRITCRTGEVPELLSRDIPELWDQKNVKFYQLMPLRRRDIRLSAGIDADAFLERVVERGISPLAIHPVSLQMLLQQFSENRELADTRWRLYEKGCNHLCKENNRDRRLPKLRGVLDPKRRMEVASRIAAVCVLADRRLIQREIEHDEPAEDTALWRDICDDAGSVVSPHPIDAIAVRDTLHWSSLFSSRGAEHLGFAHASYASFLAARYMKQHGYRLDDLTAACAGPDYRGPIPTTIRDVAGWLASEDAETRQWLLAYDARALLMSDLKRASNDELAALVAKLLDLADRQTLPVEGLQAHHRKLAHPGLAEQLQPWLQGGKGSVWGRCMAVEIAGACDCKTLYPALIELSLARLEPNILRADAIYVLLRNGETSTRRALLPLLLDPKLAAPDAWIRNQLLRSLWPEHLSEDELFAVLDAYRMRRGPDSNDLDRFIERVLVPKANDELIIRLFDRLDAHVHDRDQDCMIGLLSERLVDRALAGMDDPRLLAALARFASSCLSRHTDPFWPRHQKGRRSRIVSLTPAARRRLAKAIVDNTTAEIKPHVLRLFRLIDARDTAWMVECYLDTPSPAARALWLRLLADMVSEHPPAAGSAAEVLLCTAAEQSEEFKSALWCWFGPIEFGWHSRLVGELMTKYDQRRRARAERKQRDRQRRAAKEEVRTRLSRLKAEIRAAVPEPKHIDDLLHDLKYFEANAAGYPEDLLDMLAWRVLPAESRAELCKLAAGFLIKHPLVEPETYYWSNHYRLLRFMHGVDAAWAPQQSPALWEGWVPAIVVDVIDDSPTRTALLHEAYRQHPSLVRWCLAVLVTMATSALRFHRVCRSAQEVLGTPTVAFMADKLADDDYPAEPYGALLAFLLVQEMPGIEERLHSLLDGDLGDPRARARARIAAQILWDHTDDFSWPRLAPRFEADPTFGEEVVGLIAQERSSPMGNAWNRKREDAVAQLYAWMVQRFPEKDDPRLTMRMGDTSRYKIGRLRHSLLVNLQTRGTASSLATILLLQAQFPDEESLPYNAGYARDHVAEELWTPLTPRRVIHLRRMRPNDPPLMSFLLQLTIQEMQQIATRIDQKLADDLPTKSSKEEIANSLALGLQRRFSTLADACEDIRTILPEFTEELMRLRESTKVQWSAPDWALGEGSNAQE